jgi:chemotaxis protein MotB
VLVYSALLGFAVGCVTKGSYDTVATERDQLAKARRDLEGRVELLEAANQSFDSERRALIDETEDLHIAKLQLQDDLARLTREAAQLAQDLESSQNVLANRNTEIERVRSTYDVLVSDLESEVASGQIQIEKLRSGLTMNLSEDILFPSGSATVNSGGVAVLRKVGQRLNQLSHPIEVRGHTDSVPIAGGYPSNWELAAARASAVARLLDDVGVDPARLTVVSRAEFEPVAPNDTIEGRARNRRIEIRLEPIAASEKSASNPESDASESATESGSEAGAHGAVPETPGDPPAAEVESAPAS